MNSTKIQVYEFVKNYTTEFCQSWKLIYDAVTIGEELHISRTVVSKYLNEYYKESRLIKISTRPVYFLDKQALEKHFRVGLKQTEYYDLEDLVEELGRDNSIYRDFASAVGYDSSLSYCIQQLQSAIRYPGNGLPAYLYGEDGTGKGLLCKLACSFARNQRIIPKDAGVVYTDYSFQSWYQVSETGRNAGETKEGLEEERLMELLDIAKGGFLVIRGAEWLSGKIGQRLVDYMGTGIYQSEICGKSCRSQTRIIFISNKGSKDEIENEFFYSIPVVIKVPSLEERPVSDKAKLILQYFLKEQQRLRKKIRLSEQVFRILTEFRFSHNVKGIATYVKTICAVANLETTEESKVIQVLGRHLPGELLSADKVRIWSEEKDLIRYLDEFTVCDRMDQIIDFFQSLLADYQAYRKGVLTEKQFRKNCMKHVNVYYEYMLCERKAWNERTLAYEEVLRKILSQVSEKYKVFIPDNCVYVLAAILFQIRQEGLSIRLWSSRNKIAVDELLAFYQKNCQIEYLITDEVAGYVMQMFHTEFDSMNRIFLIINLNFYNREIVPGRIAGMIVAHGFATASSIAETVNKLLGTFIFEAIDMPWNAGIKDIADTLKKRIQKRIGVQELILLVDTGALENLDQELNGISNITVGIINNVSTWLGVSVGEKILANIEIEELLKTVCREYTCTYRMKALNQKEPMILFTSEAGIEPASRAVWLFENSIPETVNIKVSVCDYLRLQKNQEEDVLFQKYQVLLVVGTIQSKLKYTRCITLEELINAQNMNLLREVFGTICTEEEIEQINCSLIKNFSLENIMNYLSVLDADKVLSYIEAALEHLQELEHRQFSNGEMIGLYVHISNLIERLVTRTWHQKEEKVIAREEGQAFVRNFKESFARIESVYHIEIPLSEVLYVYENLGQEGNRKMK